MCGFDCVCCAIRILHRLVWLVFFFWYHFQCFPEFNVEAGFTLCEGMFSGIKKNEKKRDPVPEKPANKVMFCLVAQDVYSTLSSDGEGRITTHLHCEK